MNTPNSNNISHQPYWHDDIAFNQTNQSTLTVDELDKEQSIVIVGSGFTALSAALTLARAGEKVIIIDSADIGGGASSRNGGLLGPSFHKLGLQGLTKAYGEQRANAVLKESLAGFDWLVNFIENEQIECELTRCGRFRGALKQAQFTQMSKQAESLASALDYPVQIVNKAQQTEHVGTDKYQGGVLYTKDACLHPAKLVQGLIEKNIEAGVQILAHTPVTRVQRKTSGFSLQVGPREIFADKVLIATNGYTDQTTQQFKERILPIRSSMIATQALTPDLMDSVSPKRHTHGGTDRLVFYYRPSSDGTRLLFGGRAINYADKPQEYTQFLQRTMIDLFPQLKDVKLANAWSGLVAYSFDHVPHLGKMDGMYYAMGYCGSGVARANYLGHNIALKMLGSGGDTVFDQFEFDSKPGYNGNPWFMPAIMRWHSLADKLGI